MAHDLEARRPLVVETRSGALDDGPGIRSTVFFKGCPLRCRWCQNPETMDAGPEIAFEPDDCVSCGACARVCPRGAQVRPTGGGAGYDRKRCRRCGTCADACPGGALRRVGGYLDVESLAARLLRDEPFWRNSGGGVTLSGGEPAMFPDYCGDLLARLKARGVHTLVETCGHFNLGSFTTKMLPHLDAIWFDVKLAEPASHQRHTGQSNETILKNLAALAEAVPGRVVPRIPLVPGITATEENLRGLAAILTGMGFGSARLLPYNPLWRSKSLALGREPSWHEIRWMSAAEVARWEAVVREGFGAAGLSTQNGDV